MGKSLTLRVMAAGFIISVTATACASFGSNPDLSGVDVEELVTNGDSAQEVDYSAIDVSTLTTEQFYDDRIYPEQYRIRWAHQELRRRQTPELISGFLDILTKDKRLPVAQLVEINFQMPEPVTSSLENNGDEILWMRDLDTYTASIETDPNVGRKLLAGVIAKESEGFDRLLAQIGTNNHEPITATYRVGRSDVMLPGMETGVFYQTAVGNYVPNGVPSKLIAAKNTYDNTYSEIIVQFKEGQWVAAHIILETSSDFINRPQDLLVN